MAPKKRKRKTARKRTSVRGHLSPWARDAFGIGLVVVALLSVLALWLSGGGLAGRLIRFGVKGSIGLGAAAFPVLALYWGVLLLRDTVREERPRMFIGLLMAAAGFLGILSLLQPNPSPTAGTAPLQHAGGLYGALVAWPQSRMAPGGGAARRW